MKIAQITGLRGLVAFLIAYVLHWILLFDAIPNFHNTSIEILLGSSATFILFSPNIFFVLSGYLIHQSYNERISKEKVNFQQFLLPKIKKIYPLVIVTTIVSWGLQKLGLYMWGIYPLHADGGEIRNSFLSFALSVLGLQSGYISDNDYRSVNGPAWFVAILFLCYVLYYGITRFAKQKKYQTMIYITFMILGIGIMYIKPSLPLLYTVNGRGYYSFFVGVMMKEVLTRMKDEGKIQMYFISLVCVGYSLYRYCDSTLDTENKVLILAVLCWPSLVYLVIHGFVMKRILSISCFVWLGKIAMPIFLCNFPTQLLIRMGDLAFGWNLDYTNIWIWLLHIIISLVIAVATHYIFEEPLKWVKIDNPILNC